MKDSKKIEKIDPLKVRDNTIFLLDLTEKLNETIDKVNEHQEKLRDISIAVQSLLSDDELESQPEEHKHEYYTDCSTVHMPNEKCSVKEYCKCGTMKVSVTTSEGDAVGEVEKKWRPRKDQTVYSINTQAPDEDSIIYVSTWGDRDWQRISLSLGVLFPTEEEAKAKLKEMYERKKD